MNIKYHEILKIADLHVNRIQSAIVHIKHLFPITAERFKNISETDFAWLDLLINRFGKLQDLIGSKLINFFLDSKIEDIHNLTMLDKINKLEKLNIIRNTELWKTMREVRNHIAHEYPDHPEIMALNLNKIYELTPELINILEKLKL